MNEIVGEVLRFILSLVLSIFPYLVIIAILVINHYQIRRNVSGESTSRMRGWIAFYGAFIPASIAFVMLQTGALRFVPDTLDFVSIPLVLLVGGVVGFASLLVVRMLVSSNLLVWYVFFTNAAALVTAIVYVYLTDLREIFVYVTLGFTLGVIMYVVGLGSPYGADASEE